MGLQRMDKGCRPHEETRSRSIAQRDLSRRASLQEEGEIRRDKGKKSQPVMRRKGIEHRKRDTRVQDGHEVADRRCTSLFSAKWVLIDPGTCTQKKGGPSKEPVQFVSATWQ